MSTDGPARPAPRVRPATGGARRRLTVAQLGAAGRFRIIQATRAQWTTMEARIQEEGWDPGLSDADILFNQDPRAFFIGLLDNAPVSAVSVVTYGSRIAFLGNYFVAPAQRGRGLGLETWRVAVLHAGDRAIGLEAVPAQVPTYRRAGFSDLYSTIGYRGRIPNVRGTRQDPHIVPYLARHASAIAALDGACFPQNRPAFADAWAADPGHRTLVRTRGADVTGYGVIRPTTRGHRIGPLIGESQGDALVLFDALANLHPGAAVSFHAPEPNLAALKLARLRGLTEISRTVRMYTQPARPIALANCYAIGSLAYG
ncbi:MAG TPA: GNAT family N-acetyltransferase [Actinocrinis sp.]|nr:GNAT family N-acetyltransferase [Actinocrinis sp.]